MPNPKLGTVTTDVERAVRNAKAGSVTYRVDKQGIIHCGIGKVSFSVDALIDNCRSLMISLYAAKPEGLKGQYVKTMYVSSTMGRSVPVELATIDPNNPKFMLDKDGIAKLGF
jgi:large subunit ribosomal protein L1